MINSSGRSAKLPVEVSRRLELAVKALPRGLIRRGCNSIVETPWEVVFRRLRGGRSSGGRVFCGSIADGDIMLEGLDT